MKLRDMMGLYEGEVRVDINKVDTATGAIEDVIRCNTSELDALKDDIMDAEIIKWDVKIDMSVLVIELYI